MLSVHLRTQDACLLLLLPYLVTKLLCTVDMELLRTLSGQVERGPIAVNDRNEVRRVVIYLFALELE